MQKPIFHFPFSTALVCDVGQFTNILSPLLLSNFKCRSNFKYHISKHPKVLNDGKQEKDEEEKFLFLSAKERIGNIIQVKMQMYRELCMRWPESEGRGFG